MHEILNRNKPWVIPCEVKYEARSAWKESTNHSNINSWFPLRRIPRISAVKACREHATWLVWPHQSPGCPSTTTDGKQGGSRYHHRVLQRNTPRDPRKVLLGVQPDPALQELNMNPAAISSGYWASHLLTSVPSDLTKITIHLRFSVKQART